MRQAESIGFLVADIGEERLAVFAGVGGEHVFVRRCPRRVLSFRRGHWQRYARVEHPPERIGAGRRGEVDRVEGGAGHWRGCRRGATEEPRHQPFVLLVRDGKLLFEERDRVLLREYLHFQPDLVVPLPLALVEDVRVDALQEPNFRALRMSRSRSLRCRSFSCLKIRLRRAPALFSARFVRSTGVSRSTGNGP